MKRYFIFDNGDSCVLEDATPTDKKYREVDYKEYAKEWVDICNRNGGVAELCVICGLMVVKKYPECDTPSTSPAMLCFCKFCGRCRYMMVDNDDTDLWRIKCNHPLNLIPKQDFYEPYFEWNKPAKKINKKNKCKWFERKLRYESVLDELDG